MSLLLLALSAIGVAGSISGVMDSLKDGSVFWAVVYTTGGCLFVLLGIGFMFS